MSKFNTVTHDLGTIPPVGDPPSGWENGPLSVDLEDGLLVIGDNDIEIGFTHAEVDMLLIAIHAYKALEEDYRVDDGKHAAALAAISRARLAGETERAFRLSRGIEDAWAAEDAALAALGSQS